MMKTGRLSLVVKLLLLAAPLIVLLFMLADKAGNGAIGGGSYDLTELYYVLGATPYYLVYIAGIAINNAYVRYKRPAALRENRYCMIAALLLLAGHLVYAVKIFH